MCLLVCSFTILLQDWFNQCLAVGRIFLFLFFCNIPNVLSIGMKCFAVNIWSRMATSLQSFSRANIAMGGGGAELTGF